MAKKTNHIALELRSLENKIKEFRSYLDSTDIRTISEDEKRHQEIKIQVLLLKELGPILQQYEALKKQSDKDDDTPPPQELRGDVPLSPLEDGTI